MDRGLSVMSNELSSGPWTICNVERTLKREKHKLEQEASSKKHPDTVYRVIKMYAEGLSVANWLIRCPKNKTRQYKTKPSYCALSTMECIAKAQIVWTYKADVCHKINPSINNLNTFCQAGVLCQKSNTFCQPWSKCQYWTVRLEDVEVESQSGKALEDIC